MKLCQFSLVEPFFFSIQWDSSKHFFPNLRCFQSAITANCGQLLSVIWSERFSNRSRSSPGNCPFYVTWTKPRHWWKILWPMISKTPFADMSELTAAVFMSQRTVQVSQLSWLSKCQGFTPDRVIQGYFSHRVILHLHSQLAKLWVL